ncbi:MAG: hypothetical protein ACLPND_09225 [Candidatus Korobacteraceae bacterium]
MSRDIQFFHPDASWIPIAFEVDNLTTALEGKEIPKSPNSPGEGIMVAMILDNGASIELLQFIPPVKSR